MNKKLLKPTGWVLPSLCVVGACIEVKINNEIEMRTTGNPAVVLRATKEEWRVFINSVKAGQYDIK